MDVSVVSTVVIVIALVVGAFIGLVMLTLFVGGLIAMVSQWWLDSRR